MDTQRRRRRRRTWLVVGLVAVAVVAWLAFAALQLLAARKDALAGLRRIEDLQASLTVDSIGEGSELDSLQRAHEEFAAARDRVDHPLLLPLRIVPVVGRQVRSASALSDAAAEVTEIAVERFEAGRALLDRRGVDRSQRISYVREIVALATDTRDALDDIDLGPDEGLVGPLRRARDRFERELTRMRTTADDVAVVGNGIAGMLAGPRTYLLLASNNAEMRAGSGAFLSATTITIDGGMFELGEMRPVSDFNLPDDRVPLTGDHAARWGWLLPNREWRNLGATPRFDVNAPLAADMWQAATGQKVDGVLALDVIALQALLRATGPVDVGGTLLTADNIVHDVTLQQYVDAEAFGGREARRERLGEIAGAVVNALEEGTWDPQTLASGLVDAALGRHVLAWSRHADEQRAWEAGAVAGELTEQSLLVSVYNTGGNKLDPFLAVHADVEIASHDDRDDVAITFELRNEAPPGLPKYVAGPYVGAVGGAEGRYQGLLAVNLPAAAAGARFDGVDQLVAAGPDGPTRVVATYVELDRGASTSLTLRFRLPAGAGFDIEPTARLPEVTWSGAIPSP